ncbi:1-hydroxy-2-methyl-2-butenyl 4-diphosphate reductase [Streptomyces sp. NPDC127068]|uniref:phosphorylase family protein n=1 Tax=Streptomyces sp. NPDC127068 TaxID=3347127 RepID=UPI00364E9FD4
MRRAPADPADPPDPVGPTGGAGGPLLVACALGIERLALRLADRSTAGNVTVLRTGMGPRAAASAVGRALGRAELHGASVLATGFCAGLAPGMRPGDLVVAGETRDELGPVRCSGTAPLTEALARALPGRTVHTGPLIGSDHVVRGAERSALRSTGAIAVDMESAVTLRTAVRTPVPVGPLDGRGHVGGGEDRWVRPVAAVRVVVDAPEHELVRIGTLRGGISAFRVLRAVFPVFCEWHRIVTLPRR